MAFEKWNLHITNNNSCLHLMRVKAGEATNQKLVPAWTRKVIYERCASVLSKGLCMLQLPPAQTLIAWGSSFHMTLFNMLTAFGYEGSFYLILYRLRTLSRTRYGRVVPKAVQFVDHICTLRSQRAEEAYCNWLRISTSFFQSFYQWMCPLVLCLRCYSTHRWLGFRVF